MSIDIKIIGTITQIKETETFDSGFKKRECRVVCVDDKYSNYFDIEFFNERGDILNKFEVGDEVRFRCSLNGNLWVKNDGTELVFHKIICWGAKFSDEPTTEELRNGKEEEEPKKIRKRKKQEVENNEEFEDMLTESVDKTDEEKRKKQEQERDAVDDLPF